VNLHKAPQFLLDLFRLKTTGQQPNLFADAVSPIVEVGCMYGADMQFTGSNAPAAGALPRNTTSAIGSTSRYLGIGCAVNVGAAAGTQMQVYVGVSLPSTVSGAFFSIFSASFVPQATRTYYFGGLLPFPLTLPAGAGIRCTVTGDAGGADHQIVLLTYLEDPTRA